MKEIKCENCGEIIEDDLDIRYINPGMCQRTRRVCAYCLASLETTGQVVRCDACGEAWSADVLHDERLSDTITFTRCPSCHRDVVDGTTRAEALANAGANTFAPTFRCELEALKPSDVRRMMQQINHGLNAGKGEGQVKDATGRVVGSWRYDEGGV